MEEQLIKWKNSYPPRDKTLLLKCKKSFAEKFDYVCGYFCSDINKWVSSFGDCATPIESPEDFYFVYFWAEVD